MSDQPKPLVGFSLPEGHAQPEDKPAGFSFGAWASGVKSKVSNLFGGGEEEEGDPELVDDDLLEEETEENQNRGFGYELSWRYNKYPANHAKPFYFTTQLGDPFPSYHENPEPHFPPRWTSIPDVKPPCENLTAPRIRLGPQELKEFDVVMDKMRAAVALETHRPQPKILNLSHQSLGDPYQLEALETFLDLNNSVEVLNLSNNEIENLTTISIPHVRKLYLSKNSIASFFALPSLPACEELYLAENFITSTAGLTETKFPNLRILNLFGNPLEQMGNYRRLVLKAYPAIEQIDGVPAEKIPA